MNTVDSRVAGFSQSRVLFSYSLGGSVTPSEARVYTAQSGQEIPTERSSAAAAGEGFTGVLSRMDLQFLTFLREMNQKLAPQTSQSLMEHLSNGSSGAEAKGSTKAGVLDAAFGVAQMAEGWGQMSDGERMASVTQAAEGTVNSLDDVGVTGVGTASSVLAGASGVVGIVMGVDQAADVIDAIKDMPRSDAKKAGAIGLGSSGAAIGAGVAGVSAATGALAGAEAGTAICPVVGTAVGAVIGAAAGWAIGACGSGKGKKQMIRDSWRDALEQGEFAEVINGAHHVPLADGSLYNIGVDGSHKFENLDSTERHTFDVDWGSELAANSVPLAHLYSIATGLDPSMNEGALWTTASSQALNAALSNAKTGEQVEANFQSMVTAGVQDPRLLALRLETLRLTHRITDQEYGVYLDRLNTLFGSKLQGTPREKAHSALAQKLQSMPNPGEAEQQLLRELTDQKTIAKAEKALQTRLSGGS